MSCELIKHEKILEYSSIWMDTIRDGAFGLTNTNRLVRFYRGATGLKTGSTSKAGFCVSATAKRDGMSLICVIMGADTRDIRNAEATKLLDWGFANYELYSDAGERLNGLSVLGGKTNLCDVTYGSFSAVLPKGSAASVKKNVLIPEKLSAPIEKGGVIGKVEYTLGSEKIGEVEIKSIQNIEKIGYFDLVWRIMKKFLII
jgi:D-alanyl-D-alanine carboxypeptidase (penicillin-binding protein 5/6)